MTSKKSTPKAAPRVAPKAAASKTASTVARKAAPPKTPPKVMAKSPAVEAVETAMESGNALVDNVLKTGTEAAAKKVDEAATMTRQQVEKAATMTQEQVEKTQTAQKAAIAGYGDLVGLQKDNVEAVIRSGNIVAQGYEAIGREMMGFAQSAIEANIAATRALIAARTLNEAVELQRSHLRESLDQAVTGSSKLGELSVKLASDAVAPLQGRVNETVRHFVKPLAA